MDNHLHTTYSDGEDSLRDMVQTAIKLQYSQITFTDHVRRDSPWVDDYLREITELQEEYKGIIKIYKGVEAKIIDLDGNIDFDNKYYDKIDFVLGALHRIPIGAGQFIRSFEITNWDSKDVFFYLQKASFAVLENQLVDVLAHPFSLGVNQNICPLFTYEFCTRLRLLSIKHSKYLEYNLSKYNKCVNQSFWEKPQFKVWIGSDSHSVKDMEKYSSYLNQLEIKE
jgi:HisJ family histidinol phosphate phosphatase